MVPAFIAAFGRLPRPIRIVVVSAVAGAMLYASLAPTSAVPMASLFWDKAEHSSAYLVLMITGLIFAPRRLYAFTVFAFLLGVAVELMQASMGFGRQGDPLDLVANTIGITVGFLVWRWAVARRRT